MVDNGIKPVYVFDGKPPDMKGGELTKRAEKREEASKQLVLATDAGINKNFMVVLCRILRLHENWFLIYLQ